MRYLDRQTDYLTEVALRFGFDLTLLLVRIDVSALPEEERRSVPTRARLGGQARPAPDRPGRSATSLREASSPCCCRALRRKTRSWWCAS